MHVQTMKINDGQVVLTAVMEEEMEHEAVQSLERLAGAERTFKPLSRSAAVEKYRDAWSAPYWEADDLTRLRWVFDCTDKRTLDGILTIYRSTDRIDGDAIAESVGYKDANAWKSALPHVAIYCRRVDRRPLWRADQHDEAGRVLYGMRDEVRLLIAQLLGDEPSGG